MNTDKNLVVKGLKILAGTILCFFMGPTLIYIAQGNQEKSLYWVLLISGLFICAVAIYLGFRGIKTIMKALFND